MSRLSREEREAQERRTRLRMAGAFSALVGRALTKGTNRRNKVSKRKLSERSYEVAGG